MRTEKRVALIVGNGSYKSAPLHNPVNDARAMARALRGSGFEVLEHENLDQKQMRRAVLEFGAKLRGADVGLFYFAGHGLQVSGRNFLVPIDAVIETESEIEVESVDVASILARMEAGKTRVNIVILDACRDNPFGRSFRSTAGGLASIDAPSGTLIAYATAPGKVARDGLGANGLYTDALLEAIAIPGLRIEDVFKRVRQSLQKQTKGAQVPWESSSLVGDFIFALPPPVKIAAPPAPTVGEGSRRAGSTSRPLAAGTPLPTPLVLTPPDGAIPAAVAAFHGEWIGRWRNGRESTLVVQRIERGTEKGVFRATGVYSFGSHEAESEGFREFDATIRDGQLLIRYGNTIIRYTIAKDLRHLNGVWDSIVVVVTGEFQKAPQ
jgi:hypothetical protein